MADWVGFRNMQHSKKAAKHTNQMMRAQQSQAAMAAQASMNNEARIAYLESRVATLEARVQWLIDRGQQAAGPSEQG